MLQNHTHFTKQLLQKSFYILCLGFTFGLLGNLCSSYMLRDCDAMYSVTQSLDFGSCLQRVYSEYHVVTWVKVGQYQELTETSVYIIFCRLWCTNSVLCCGRPGGIPARNSRGERLLLFIGIIDILQSYRLKKKLEHTWKAMIHDGVSFPISLSPGFTWYWLLQNGKLKLKGQNCIYLHHMQKQGCVVVCVQVHNILVGKLQDIAEIFS